jgi:3-phenylpropionate/trans-cinnamate dioxygenase ferredoxin subunit
MTKEFIVGTREELPPGKRKLAIIEGQGIVLFNIDGALCAIENPCPHNGASLASGKLDGPVLSCPAHGMRFDVRTGRMPSGDGLCVATFPVEERDGRLVVVLEASSTRAE